MLLGKYFFQLIEIVIIDNYFNFAYIIFEVTLILSMEQSCILIVILLGKNEWLLVPLTF